MSDTEEVEKTRTIPIEEDVDTYENDSYTHTTHAKKLYTKEEIVEIIDDTLHQTCSAFLSYIKKYSDEHAIPLGDKLAYSSLHRFMVTGS